MRPLIISRKSKKGFGGLNRFYTELSGALPNQQLCLSPDSLLDILKLPFQKPTHIYLCDATLLPLGILLKTLLHKPLIVTAHGLDITYANPLYQKMVRAYLPKADAIALDSIPTKKLIKNIPTIQPIQVIPPGVTTKQFLDQTPIALPNLKNKVVMTTVGNLVQRKGHVWFVEHIMPRLSKNYLYLIVGAGVEKAAIQQAIKENMLFKRVFLLGQLTNQELSFVLNRTNIYVSPNQHEPGNFESFGIANGEAARLGIPVVASNVDGISEIIQHNKNGLLIPPTPQAFISALTLLKDAALRKRLGKKAKLYTKKKYTWEITARKYASLFKQTDTH